MILLRCIDKGSYHLTVGKHYVAEPCLDSPSEFFPGKQVFDWYIVNDKGVRHRIEKELFVSVNELRDLKLRTLGI